MRFDFVNYITEFLLQQENDSLVSYSSQIDEKSLITIIKSDFFNDNIYGTVKSFPVLPFNYIQDTDIPFLYGDPKVININGKIVIYADLIASTFFFFSRYEEYINKTERDQFGRFLAKDSIIYKQGYLLTPLVDIWGKFLREKLTSLGVSLKKEKRSFNKILMTHDIDTPFLYTNLKCVFINPIKQFVKKLLKKGNYKAGVFDSIKGFYCFEKDPYYTFPFFVKWDNEVADRLGYDVVESIYFIISAGTRFSKQYFDVNNKKFKKLLAYLIENNSKFGVHISLEAGKNPKLIKNEIELMPRVYNNGELKSRHHFLRWCEPEDVEFLEQAGISSDYTLGYADCVGFRCGTTKSFKFINPKNLKVTNVEEFPLHIMEGTLYSDDYMNLNYERSLEICKKIIDTVYEFNGNLNILFHNSNMTEDYFNKELYIALCDYIVKKHM